MEDFKKKPVKKELIKCVALKNLNCGGMVMKGKEFKCTEDEYYYFKGLGAV